MATLNWKHLILRILRKVGALEYLNITLSTKLNGIKFRIPIFHGSGLDHFYPSEMWMGNLIAKLLKLKGGQFIDVGANIGQTLLKLQSVDQDIKYVGFEPNPKCVYYLNELIGLNSFTKVSIIPMGIFSFDGIAQLYFNRDNAFDSCATLVKEFRDVKDQERIMVPVISGSSLGFLNGEISILKIDVEGAEVEVLEQFKGIINTRRPFVICEILPAYSSNNTFRVERQKRIESLFAELNYKIAQIGHQLVRIDTIPINNDVDDSNYLFFPDESASVLF